ncbi:MAG: hypothetical protein WCI73_15145 [Phycisphaerae bacterium]
MFCVKDQVLWPAVCPACDYMLRGLPVPRCPECGERIEEGEVVLVGSPTSEQAGDFQSLPLGIGTCAVSTLLAVLFFHWRQKLRLDDIIFWGVWFCLAVALVTLRWWVLRRRGFPAGVLRLSAAGYVYGAGSTKGTFRSWSSVTRVDFTKYGKDKTRFRGYRFWGPVPFSTVFDIIVECSNEQRDGLVERLRAWGPQGMVIRRHQC